MSRCVLDASALLALLNQEPGGEQLSPTLMHNAVMSSVNAAEVQTTLVRDGAQPEEAWSFIQGVVPRIEAFGEEHAKVTGTLVASTKPLGLSLGDRACLALGVILKLPVYTADRVWSKLKIGVRVHVLQ